MIKTNIFIGDIISKDSVEVTREIINAEHDNIVKELKNLNVLNLEVGDIIYLESGENCNLNINFKVTRIKIVYDICYLNVDVVSA